MSCSVATYLSPSLDARVLAALRAKRSRHPASKRIIRCESSDDLVRIAAGGGARLIIADPMQEQGKCSVALAAVRNQHPSTAVVLYLSSATPISALRLVELARNGMHDAVFYGHGDSPNALANLITRALGSGYSTDLIEELSADLGRMPPAIRNTVVQALENPGRYRFVDDLARAATVSRRTLYSKFRVAGIASPRRLLAGALVLNAVALLQNQDATVGGAARALGYSSPQRLTRELKALTGLTIDEVRRTPERQSIVRRIAQSLRDG